MKPVLEEYTKLIFAKGPTSFTLLHHAKVGGEESRELFDYLNEKGMKETKVRLG